MQAVKYNVLIVEDDPAKKYAILSLLKKLENVKAEGVESFDEALHHLESNNYSVVILDEQLRDEEDDNDAGEGHNIGQYIRREELNTQIIYLTAFSKINQVAMELADTNPYAIIAKLTPNEDNDLLEAVSGAVEQYHNEEIRRNGTYQFISTQSAKVQINIQNLIWGKSDSNTSEFHVIEDGEMVKYIASHSIGVHLKAFDNKWGNDSPIKRCHKSYIVNIKQVKQLKYDIFKFNICEDTVPLGNSFRKKFQDLH